MLKIADLCDRYKISDFTARRWVDSLATVLAQYERRGQKNALLFETDALAVFDRFAQLTKESLTYTEAAAKVEEEMLPDAKNNSANEASSLISLAQNTSRDYRDEMIELLKQQNELLRNDIKDLKQDLNLLTEEVQNLQKALPPPQGGRSVNSRWEALRFAFMGR
jgi:predicted RNase H-like nuclease (RuvC/YqgF family)